MKLIHKSRNEILLENVHLADSTFSRIKGLLFTKELGEGDGLWLIPCNAVHMFGMNYPIDVIFLDKNNRVVKMIAGLKPNQMSPIVFGAHSVIEAPAEFLLKHPLDIDDVLEAA